jgi:hypothetical protein
MIPAQGDVFAWRGFGRDHDLPEGDRHAPQMVRSADGRALWRP